MVYGGVHMAGFSHIHDCKSNITIMELSINLEVLKMFTGFFPAAMLSGVCLGILQKTTKLLW